MPGRCPRAMLNVVTDLPCIGTSAGDGAGRPRSALDKKRGGQRGGGIVKIDHPVKMFRIAQIAILATATSTIVSLAPRPAQAIAIFTGNGLCFTIPDSNATGAFSDIVLADNFLISDITVSLNALTHTYIGELIATLTHLDSSTTVDLFRRVGFPASFGDSSNLNGIYNFNDAFTGDLWAVAASLTSSSNVIPGGYYFPTGAASATKVPMLTTISGLPSSGTWRLRISDNSAGDTGALGSWTLNLQGSAAVPGPLPLLGAGAAFGWSRRLRKRSRAAL